MKKIFRIIGLICFPFMLIGGFVTAFGLKDQPYNIWIGFIFLMSAMVILFISWMTFIIMDKDWFKSIEKIDEERQAYQEAKDNYLKVTNQFRQEYFQKHKN